MDFIWPTRLLCPWDSPGQNIGVGCHFLLQGIFLTQGSNLCVLHCRQILYLLSHLGSMVATEKTTKVILVTFFKRQILLILYVKVICARHSDLYKLVFPPFISE